MQVFGFRVDDFGRVRYESPYANADFTTGPGRTRLAGRVRFAPMTWAEDAALQGFLLDLDGDSTDHVYLPWFRDGGRDGEGVFPFGTTFAVTSLADATRGARETTRLNATYTLPSDASEDQVELHVGSVMTLNDTLVRFVVGGVVQGGGSIVAHVFPRVESASPNVLREGRVKARIRASRTLLERSGQTGLDPIVLPWVEVP